MFNDPEALKDLNAIVHPEVARMRHAGTAAALAAGAPVVVADIPLLFEAGLHDAFDTVVFVDASDATRLDRLVRARGLTDADARAMMASQMDPTKKHALANHVITNDGTLEELHRQVDALWHTLTGRPASA